MPVEMGVWRMDGDTPRRLPATAMPTEVMLEEFLERDPSLLGERLLVIGRQVRTPYGKLIVLLAMDVEGNLHVLELKRDKTPRDVVAQMLDYRSWATTLDRGTIIDLANEHLGSPFETAFEDVYGNSAPDELNASLSLVVVATDLDPTSEWNGTDWFASFGDEGTRSWNDGHRYGFISAGGGTWHSGSLHNLPVGARINVHIPTNGYVAIGDVLRPATRFDQAEVLLDGEWVRLADQNSACELRQEFTLDRLAEHFALDQIEDQA